MRIDFLICSERSGSNLITRLINAHSQICAPSTTHLFRVLGENVAGYGLLRDDAGWRALVDDAADLLATTLGPWLDDRAAFVDTVLAPTHTRSLGALLRTLYEREAEAAGKKQLFVKEIELFRFKSFLEIDFPAARYVYLVRDPRDMALSWKKSAAIRGGVVRAAQAWHRDQMAYAVWVKQLALQQRVVQLTYEQLIARPEVAMQAVCRQLDVTFEATQLQFHERTDTQALAGAAADFANLQQPLMRDNALKFRTGLSETEIRYVEGLCGKLMQEFGYQLTQPVVTNLDELAAELSPLEPQQKAAYEQVSDHERQARARWVEISQRIRQRAEAVR